MAEPHTRFYIIAASVGFSLFEIPPQAIVIPIEFVGSVRHKVSLESRDVECLDFLRQSKIEEITYVEFDLFSVSLKVSF